MKFLNGIEKAERLLTNISGLIKGKNGKIEQAVAGEDYATPTNVSDAISSHNSNSGAHSTQFSAKLDKSGGTMTGALILAGDPTGPFHAATKQYVDNNKGGAPQLVELKRFTSSGTFSPADYPSVGNRYLIMLLGAGGGGYYRDSDGTWWPVGGSAGGLLFVDFYYPPNSPITSFPVIVGAGASGSDGGSTSFWGFSVPGGNKAWGTNKPGAGVSVAGFTSESGQLNSGGNSLYGAGATDTTSAGYGGGGKHNKPGGNGLCIIYGYVA